MSQFIDPTFLRYIYDGIQSGAIHKDNESSLPDGLVGMYEEALPPESNVKERKKILEFFGVWALMKKEVSVNLISRLFGNREEQTLNLFHSHTKYFNALSSGKSELYHPRFRAFLLKRIDMKYLLELNQKIITECLTHINDSQEEEITAYSLQYLSFHLYWQASNLNWIHKKNCQLEALQKLEIMVGLFLNKETWQIQYKNLNDKKWILNSIRDTMCAALFLNHELYTVKAAATLIEVENGIRADIDSLFLHAKDGNATLLIERFKFLIPEKLISEDSKVYSSALIILLFLKKASNFSRGENKITLRPFIDFIYERQELLEVVSKMLPDAVRFSLCSYLYENNIKYKPLITAVPLSLTGNKLYQSPLMISLEKYRHFMIEILNNQEDVLNSSLIDTFLYSALEAQDNKLAENVWQKIRPHHELSSKTIISWALRKIEDQNSDEALKYFADNKYCNAFRHDFISACLDINGFNHSFQLFYENFKATGILLFLMELEAVCLHQNRVDLADYVSEIVAATPIDTDKIDERLLLDSIQKIRKLLNIPAIEYFSTTSDEIFTSDSTIQFMYDRYPGIILSKFYDSGLGFYDLGNKSVNLISKLMGKEGLIDKYLLYYEDNVRTILGKSLQTYDQFVYDASVYSFAAELPNKLFSYFLLHYKSVILSDTILGYSLSKVLFQFKIEVQLYKELLQKKQMVKAQVLKRSINEIIASKTLPYMFFEKILIEFYLTDRTSAQKMVVHYFKNLITDVSRIRVNHDLHLAQLVMELFSIGEHTLAMSIVRKIDYTKLVQDKRFAGVKWNYFIENYIDFCLSMSDYTYSVELACKSGGLSAIYKFHRIAMQLYKNNRKDEFNIVINIKNELEQYKNDKSYNRYQKWANKKCYFKGIIILAETCFLLGDKNQSNQYYHECRESLNADSNKKGTDFLDGCDKINDENEIMKLLAASILKTTNRNMYHPIVKYIARLTNLFDDEWALYSYNLKIQLKAFNQADDAEVIQKKLIIYTLKTGKNIESIITRLDRSQVQQAKPPSIDLNYISGYENKRKKIFSFTYQSQQGMSRTDDLINILIQLASFKLVIDKTSNDPVVTEIRRIININKVQNSICQP